MTGIAAPAGLQDEAVGLGVALVDDVQAVGVAQVDEVRMRRIVAGAYCIDVVTLHQEYVVEHVPCGQSRIRR
jgi:hypothetical protein